MHFWTQIVAFYFLQFIHVWISVMMIIFRNTESGNKGNKLNNQKSWLLLLLLSLFRSYCICLAKPEDLSDKRWVELIID